MTSRKRCHTYDSYPDSYNNETRKRRYSSGSSQKYSEKRSSSSSYRNSRISSSKSSKEYRQQHHDSSTSNAKTATPAVLDFFPLSPDWLLSSESPPKSNPMITDEPVERIRRQAALQAGEELKKLAVQTPIDQILNLGRTLEPLFSLIAENSVNPIVLDLQVQSLMICAQNYFALKPNGLTEQTYAERIVEISSGLIQAEFARKEAEKSAASLRCKLQVARIEYQDLKDKLEAKMNEMDKLKSSIEEKEEEIFEKKVDIKVFEEEKIKIEKVEDLKEEESRILEDLEEEREKLRNLKWMD
ncbi:hypothetical protein ACFE04_030150 [Oxalis oulophora]